MAPSAGIPRPGSKLGPCRRCEHRDCQENRATAESTCPDCRKGIGYGTPYYRDPDTVGRYVHAVCLEERYAPPAK